MKVLFLYFNINTYNIRHFPMGVGALSAYIKKYGHLSDLIYFQEDIEEEDFVAQVKAIKPDLIGLSFVTHQFPYAMKYARIIKKNFHLPILCGGMHATFMPDDVLKEAAVDMVCIGEGEKPLLDLLEQMAENKAPSTIAGLRIKKTDGSLLTAPVGNLIEDLDVLPPPDRELVVFQNYLDASKTEPVIMTSRGCPYNCSYCSNSVIKKLYQGKGAYLRQRSPSNVIAEIVDLKARYLFDSLNFYDECFGYNHKWLNEFCALYKKEVSLPFGCFVRIESMNYDLLKMMREAGLEIIYIGIESGDENLRRKVLNRNVFDQKIIDVCRDAQGLGIQVWTFNMVGIPGETEETIKKAMDLNRLINPTFVCVFIYQPLPGTALYDECIRKNYIKKTGDIYTNYFDQYLLDQPSISNDQVIDGYKAFLELADQIRFEQEKKGNYVRLVDI